MRGVRQPLFNRTFLLVKTILGFRCGVLLKVGEEFFTGNLRNLFPFRFHGVQCCLGLALRGCCRADEVPVSHHENSRHRLGFFLPEGSKCCTKGRRPQYFPIKRACGPQIRRVLVAAGNERAAVYFRNRFPRNCPFGRRRDGIFRREVLRERLAARKLRILKRAARCGVSDSRVDGNQSGRLDAPLLRCGLYQNIPGRSRHAPQLRRHGRSRPAAKSSRVKRGQSRVCHHHANALKRHAQFVRNGLRKFRANVLPNFSFAGESGYAAVFADVQPCANVLWQLFVVKAPVPRRCLLRHHRIFRNCEDGDSRAKNSEKIAARQFELME